MSSRERIRERRRHERQRRRITYILIAIGVALVITALLILPTIRPLGEITQITPQDWPEENGTSLGDESATVLVEVFEDFQCPSCAVYSEDIEPVIIENYVADGQVHYVFRQFPFLGPDSDRAAIASLCAADQNRFWDYHKILFANQGAENTNAYSDRRLAAYAEAINLDMGAFETCYSRNPHSERIQEELALGREMGVTGTPSVFVNGQQISPGFVPSYEAIQSAIEAELP